MSKSPTVLLLDIETSPILGYVWTTYEANVLKIVQSSQVISVAWKELSDANVTVKALCDYKGYKKGVVDDEALIKEVWSVLDKADVLIAHHGDAFDIKKLNSRFVYHGLSAPSSYKSVDTLKIAKRRFKFDSNSLNNLGQYLGVGKKLENSGFSLWLRCLEDGDPEAWKLMKEYNAQDVTLLEQVYLRLRPYIDNHPNISAMVDKPEGDTSTSCPTCLSSNVVKRGFSVTRTGRKQRYQCQDCASWSSGSFQRLKTPILSGDED